MLGRSLGLLSCALAASALLIPSNIALEHDVLPFEIDTKSQLIKLPCPSCAWPYKDLTAEQEDDNIWAQGGANDLLLNFTISEDGQGLMLNDHFIYPMEKMVESGKPMAGMTIDQLPASTSNDDIRDNDFSRTSLEVTGAGVSEANAINADDSTLIPLHWKLISIADQPMDLSPVFIQLIRAQTGELLILSIETAPREHSARPMFKELDDMPSARPHKRPCHMPGPLCALADFIGTTFHTGPRKPCSGRKHSFDGEHLPTHIRPHFGRPEQGRPQPDRPEQGQPEKSRPEPGPPSGRPEKGRPEKGRPEPGPPSGRPSHRPHGPPGHHGHHGHRHHGFFHSVSRGLLAVIIPVMAGVTVGVLVSVLGLLFGRFLGYLWFTFFRGGRRGYASVAAEDSVEQVVEKQEDALPRYEDTPAYEEVDSKSNV